MPPKKNPEDLLPVGRPTIYRPIYCKRVIEMGKKGFSKTQMAAKFDVAKSTLQEWEKNFPEFSVALTRAMVHSQAWWEAKGQKCLVMPQGKMFQGNVWGRSMAARFPDDWRESSKTELTGANGDPLVVNVMRFGESK